LVVADGAAIHPVVQSLALAPEQQVMLPTGTFLSDVAAHTTLPAGQREPVSIALRSKGALLGATSSGLTIGSGAEIVTDPKGQVTLETNSNLDVKGSIVVPGGTIALSLNNGGNSNAAASLKLEPGARLDVAGTYLPQLNTQNLRLGDVLPGGSV